MAYLLTSSGLQKFSMKKVIVHSPGTVANLVCGFDILGLALNEPYDVMELTLLNEPKIIIHNRDKFNLPTEAEKNVAGVVLLSIIEKMNNTIGFELTIEKHIKPGAELVPVLPAQPELQWQLIIYSKIFSAMMK